MRANGKHLTIVGLCAGLLIASSGALAQTDDDAQKKQEAAEAKQRAEALRKEEERQQAIAREKSCVIKPVMTDEEIAHCKKVWSAPPPPAL
jgi:hypothetical protein